ncbi:SAF domain-containing protein [uncultured Tessaracoccus sp.]|uniref:SAF domain-containing protein n=1 Tax=uncultured Tessaracoccus sp. TaxID=905023 RepID=UPI00260E76F4|nr:SAF domain-containing protein [uncultured Tessaracoccus sp.]
MQLLRRLGSFINWHRRVVAALCAAAVVAGIVSIASAPPSDGEPVVALATDVPAGEALSAEHLTTVRVPTSLLTEKMLRSPDEAVSAHTAVALEAGQVLTKGLLLRGGGVQKGHALVPVSVPDQDLRNLLVPGTTVELVVALGEQPEVLGRARVAAQPSAPTSTIGATKGSSMVLMEVTAELAPSVATLGQSGQLAVVIGGL